jgi:hypothetical protein
MGPGTSAAISSLGVSIDVNALYADAGALS